MLESMQKYQNIEGLSGSDKVLLRSAKDSVGHFFGSNPGRLRRHVQAECIEPRLLGQLQKYGTSAADIEKSAITRIWMYRFQELQVIIPDDGFTIGSFQAGKSTGLVPPISFRIELAEPISDSLHGLRQSPAARTPVKIKML